MIEVRELVKKVKEAKNKKLWKSISVQAMTRALRTEWTAEMANDISSFSGIDTINKRNK